MYAGVIVDISHEKLDRKFEYIIPDEMLQEIYEGVRVNIPFGKGNRLITGYVVSVSDKCEFAPEKLKKIESVIKGSVPIESQLIALAAFIRNNYGSTMNQALKTVIPVRKATTHIVSKTVCLKLADNECEEYFKQIRKKNARAKIRLMEELLENRELPYELVTDKLNISSATLKAMINDGAICVEEETKYRNPIKNLKKGAYNIILNDEQRVVADNIAATFGMEKIEDRTHLIHGITGSGKTEVYIDLIDRVINEGKEVIVLIPEIALTYQTVMRFYRKFGDKVSIINSRMSAGERYDQYERAKKGEISIIIGPRSGLFTPFSNLGLIIIDEEHEGAYKSEGVPKYHAREVAIERARMSKATVVMGSATPSVDSFYSAMNGEYRLHSLSNRAKDSKLSDVSIVDMRKELELGNRSMFSKELDSLVRDRLDKKEQIMLFLNRRGYAGFVSCRKCGHVMKCEHCDVSMTAHNDGTLKCHYCGNTKIKPKLCPKCSSKYIGLFGTGTEKVEEYVKNTYKEAKVLRMDMDTTSGKDGHEKILSAFANKEADILIGTQMIVKGHDFPFVTLVGIVAADMSLYASDYRASERTFQLLTQAAGRAGRGDLPGNVVIQTYNPEEFSIVTAAKQNYVEFYENEIVHRKVMGYPPTMVMTAVLVTSKNEQRAKSASEFVKKEISGYEGIRIIGPTKAAVSKINDVYRYVLYLKSPQYKNLTKVTTYLQDNVINSDNFKGVSIQFDFNPLANY